MGSDLVLVTGGPFMPMSEIANVLKERLDDKAKKVPTRKLPDWLVRFVGWPGFDAHYFETPENVPVPGTSA